MPFTSTNVLPDNPDVQVFFHGLLLLGPANNNQCAIGVHNVSAIHRFSVDVRVKNSAPADPPLLRLFGGLDQQGLRISAVDPLAAGVGKFVRNNLPFDRNDPNNDLRDFRWSLDLERLDPAKLPTDLGIKGDLVTPGVLLTDGLLHTAQLTDPAKVIVEITNPANQKTIFNRIAHVLGANIYLKDGGSVLMEWSQNGQEQRLKLAKRDDGGSYVVYIDNSPPLIEIGVSTHDEFAEYYKVTSVPAAQQFSLAFRGGPAGSDRIPCMPVVVGGGGS